MTNLEKIRIDDVLHRYKSDFVKDFSIKYVQREVEHIFTATELEYIRMGEATINDAGQEIEKLFFTLIYKNKNITYFIEAIREKYFWLSERMENALADTDNNEFLNEVLSHILKLRDDAKMPRHGDYNVHRLEHLFDVQSKLLALQRNEHLVIQGNLVYGKRWLAVDACSSAAVMDNMDNNIYWLNLTKCNTKEEILEQLERLLVLIDPKESNEKTHIENTANKIENLKKFLIELLKKPLYKNCLLILADLQNHETLDAFKLQCKTLITTRNKSILDKLPYNSTKIVEITKGFTEDESLELLSKVLKIDKNVLPTQATEIHELCRGNPFIILLIASNLKENSISETRWKMWEHILTDYKSTNDEEFNIIIERSLIDLIDEHRTLFQSLVIFTDNINIPISILQLYWNKGEKEVEDIINKFDKMYLVERIKNGKIYFSLQYHYYSYLMINVPNDEKQRFHKKLVDSYKLLEAIEQRTEPNILVLPDDKYFFFYIAHHLKEAQMIDVFPKLFLDFGFLEQKLRATGLPNTLGDLNQYFNEITNHDNRLVTLLNELLEFLPNVEELITKSKDTCLLQYAITTDSELQLEAQRQAATFENRIWFDDKDHINRHRQVVTLSKKPFLVKFLNPDTALIAFDNNSILLTDLSPYYTIEPTLFNGHNYKIIDIQIFLPTHFLSLDAEGNCKLWSLINTPIQRRRASSITNGRRRRVRQSRTDSINFDKINRSNCLKTIRTTDDKDKITCFCYLKQQQDPLIYLFCGTKLGRVLIFEWNSTAITFDNVSYSVELKIRAIQSIETLSPNYLMLLDTSGYIYCCNLKQTAYLTPTKWVEYLSPINLHVLPSLNNDYIVVVVFKHKIIQIKFKILNGMRSEHSVELYSSTSDSHNYITCSTISDDSKYLILGTKMGLMVFDLIKKEEILRSSVSDHIMCLDICSLDNSVYKYVLLSSTMKGGRSLYIYGLELGNDVIQWASDRMGSPINEESLLEKGQLNTWLLGGKHFEVSGIVDDQDFHVAAIDSKGAIQHRSSDDKFVHSVKIVKPFSKITTLSAFNVSDIYFGCANGDVYSNESDTAIMCLGESIRYLKCFNADLIIAATHSMYAIWCNGRIVQLGASALVVGTFWQKGSNLVIVKSDCSFELFNITKFEIVQAMTITEKPNLKIGGFDFVGKSFVIGTRSNDLYWWTLDSDLNTLKPEMIPDDLIKVRSMSMSCIKLSQFDEYLAVGYALGLIELYKLDVNNPYLIKKLFCHQCSINAMLFSPWSMATAAPPILVSISESICFWNVSQIINNPDDSFTNHSNLRKSQRFSKRYSMSPREPLVFDFQLNGTENGQRNGDSVVTKVNGVVKKHEQNNPWIGKTGASDNQVLLSCIKFVGNSAERVYANQTFTKFLTIDDEGNIYNLSVLNFHATDGDNGHM